MTYKEKFVQELFHGSNERREEMVNIILRLACPINFGYEDEFYCNQDGCLIEGKCQKCWGETV